MIAKVSLVFVTTNEGNVLMPALESVEQSTQKHPIETIVVDNASTDGFLEQVRQRWPEVKILTRDSIHGLPSNLNLGIQSSTGDYVMLCNSDIVIAREAIDELAFFLDSREEAAAVAPRLVSPEGERRPSARRWYTLSALVGLKGPWRRWAAHFPAVGRNVYDDWEYGAPLAVDWVPCTATMFRRNAFDEVGIMDERFRLYFDDVDISLRLHQAGWEVWCVPSAEVVHLEQRASLRPFSRPWRWHLESLVKFWWKHKGLKPGSRGSGASPQER